MNPPAFQFYADDFLGGTITMSHAERGFYILLLSVQWTQGGILPEDFNRLGKGMAVPSLNHVRRKFQIGADGLLKNARMEAERKKQAEFRENRSKSGLLGAKLRWHSHSTAITQPMASGMANDSSPSPTPSPIVTNKQKGLPTLAEVTTNAEIIGMKKEDAIQFWHHFESAGWIDKNGHAVVNWRSKQQTWKTQARASLAESAHKAEENTTGTGCSNITLSKEYERCIARIKQLQDGCAQDAMGKKFWREADRKERDDLVRRRDELRKTLRITI